MNIGLRTKMLLMSFIVVSVSIVTSGWIMVYRYSEVLEKELGERTMAIARTVAQMPEIKNNVGKSNGEKVIQPIVERTRVSTKVNYIVVFDMNRIRYSHPSEEQIGKPFVGGDENASLAEHEYISKALGTLGYSVRAFVPIMDEEGVKQVGVAVVGILLPTFQSLLGEYRNNILLSLLWGLSVGLGGSLILANHIKKQTLNMEPYEIARMVEERSAVMQAMDMGIITVDENGKITFMNRLAKQYTELVIEDKRRWMHLSDIFPTTWKTMVTLLKDQNQQNMNRNIVLNNRTYLISLFNIIVKGKFAGSLITMTDRTEANRLAEELTGAKTLVDALRAQNHEYMNKLHSIAGLIQLNRTEDALEFIIEETTIEENILQFLKEAINNHPVSGLLIGKKSRARELNIDFKIDHASYLYELVDGFSSGELVTIVGNLIENSFESFSDKMKKPQVECLIQGDETKLLISVKDNGAGIAADRLSDIFTYGYSTKKREERGIGLALVKNIVENHDGQINVTSTVGVGTNITIIVERGRTG
ncbi:sensor histidine kinase [Robertmurraya sp. DFI.2.37]|uniref:ATP-binding protein n=1 Tax=Robertmurraya sp. DFI.2.37 TaxID=3031819 RepID=UPI0023DAD968|nr:sensor histidine kinase [Robertmurraya sp. DFI.2.37]MDF1510232.1 sensor histidine kinase [Robertmurraya sp. DFI.2.37]